MSRIFFVLLFAACTAFAQLETSPESVFMEYAEAARSWDVDRIVSLTHPEALSTFRETIDNALTGKKSDQARKELLPYFSVSSYEEFKLLSDDVVYQRMNDTVKKNLPHLVDVLANSEYEITERLDNGSEVVIVYRINFLIEGNSVAKETLQRLKLYDGEWRLLLPPDSEATIANLEAMY